MSTENNATDKRAIATALLAEYAKADEAVNAAKAALEEANKVRSEVVKQINDKVGKGPFEYQGNYLGKVVVRDQTYFFRGRGGEGTMKIG